MRERRALVLFVTVLSLLLLLPAVGLACGDGAKPPDTPTVTPPPKEPTPTPEPTVSPPPQPPEDGAPPVDGDEVGDVGGAAVTEGDGVTAAEGVPEEEELPSLPFTGGGDIAFALAAASAAGGFVIRRLNRR